MNEAKAMGIRLAAAMSHRGVLPKELAGKTGIAYNTILAYMRGDRNPTMFNIVSLCRALDISADWLLGIVPPR